MAGLTQLLPVGTRPGCDCPRVLTAAKAWPGIERNHRGRVVFPNPMPFVALKLWHRESCSAAVPTLEQAS